MLRAVPSTIRIAASISLALRSFIFVSAIWRTWSRVSVPTFWRIWAGLPFSSPAAFLIRSEAGGVLSEKVNERSSKTMISTGMMLPDWEEVRSLYSLQKAMMLAPCWPRAGPTGGAGVALPASSWSLMTDRIFFATGITAPPPAGSPAPRAPEPLADLDLGNGGDHGVEDDVFRVHGLDALLQVGAGLILVAGVGVND